MHRRLLALALLLAGSCSPDPADKNTLLWARGDDCRTLDPPEIEWGEDAKITQNVFESLITFKDDSVEIEGRLAKSWNFSADGKTLTFELREGVKFHDGTPFNADAVVYTFKRILESKLPEEERPKFIPYEPNFEVIADVRADGPARAVFTLKSPSAVILYDLSLFGAAIVSPGAVKKLGRKFAQNPVGTGPYKFIQWDRDVRIVLDRFEGYWGPKPPIARVIVVRVPSPQAAIEKLKKGEVHVVDHPTVADVKPLQEHPATKIDTETSLNVGFLAFNMNKAPYNDLNFRRAVSLALDRKTLNSMAYYDLGEMATNVVPPAIWRGICPTPEYELDLAKAKEALGKVKLESKQVNLIHVTVPRPYFPEPQRVAEWVKDQLAKIGLDVKLEGFDRAAFDQKYKEKDHPMVLLGWNADFPDPDNFFYPLLHGDSAASINSSFFNDPVFNDVVKRAQSELDPAKRKALYTTAYQRYREELPTIPLIHVKQIIALSRKVDYNMHPIEFRFYIASLKN
jgi:peptide/nickel transport system substrate-binding protein